MTYATRTTSLRRKLCVSTVLAGGALAVTPAHGQTLPSGETVVVGTPTFDRTVPNQLTVNLNDTKTIINWGAPGSGGFSIGAGGTVNFTDGAALDLKAVLNRDLSGNISAIDGTLTSDSNISVYLINPTGIVFGTGANVNVGSLVASTLDLTDIDFLTPDASDSFSTSTAAGGIQLNGSAGINASGGILFVTPQFTAAAGSNVNAGGNVAIVAAEGVTVTFDAGSPIGFTIAEGTTVSAPVQLAGTVQGKNVYVAAATKGGVTDALLDIGGVVQATGAVASGDGRVVLTAGTSATDVTVAGPTAQTGGAASIRITGSVIAPENAEVRALNNITGSGSISADNNVSISSNEGNINLTGPIRSLGSSTISASGPSSTTTLTNVEAGGNVNISSASVALPTAQIRSTGGNVTVTGTTDVTGGITTVAGNNVTFNGTVDGLGALAVNSSGATSFNDDVGGTSKLVSLTTDAGGSTMISGDVRTNDGVIFNDALILAGAGTRTIETGTARFQAINSEVAGTTGLIVDAPVVEFDQSVGTAKSLASLTVNGGTNIDGTDTTITTTGSQSYNGGTSVRDGGSTTFNSTGSGAITFGGQLNGGDAVTVNTSGVTTFDAAVGNATQLTSLTTDAGGTTAIDGGEVSTSGDQTYGDLVSLGADATLTGVNGTFGGGVQGNGFDLTLNFSGTNTIDGSNFSGVGDLTTGNGGTTNLHGTVTTTGTQTYNDAVVLTSDTTLASSGDAAISLASTVNGAHALTVNTTGTTTFGGLVGGTTELASVTTNVGGTTAINGGGISTSGAQTYNDGVTLGAATTLVSSGGGVINLASTVNGAQALTVNTTGTTTFGGAVGGSTALTSVTTDAGGTTAISGGAITTTAGQTFGDAVTLGADTVLTSSGGGAIDFGSTVNSDASRRALTVTTSGDTFFRGLVGGTSALFSLTTNGGGTTFVNGGGVTTVGTGPGNTPYDAQLYQDDVVLGADALFQAPGSIADIRFGGTVSGAFNLAVATDDLTVFGGAVNVASVTNNLGTTQINGGSVTTSGGQSFAAVTLGQNTTLESTAGGAISVAGALNGAAAGAQALTVNTSGTTTFGGPVGNLASLASLTTDAGGTTAINGGSVTTTGDQTFGDPVALGGNTVLTGANSSFASVDGGGNNLTLNFTGTTAINGATFTNIRDLASGNGGTTSLTGTISTTGTQTYSDAITLAGNTALSSNGTGSAGNIAFGNTVSGAFDLSASTNGSVSFANTVSGLNSLAVSANGVTFTSVSASNEVSLAGGSAATSGTSADSTSGSVRLSGSSVTLTGAATAGVDVIVSSPGAISLASATAGDDIKIASSGSTAFLGSATLTGTGTDAFSGPGDTGGDGRVLRVTGASGATLGNGSGSFTSAGPATAEVTSSGGAAVVNLGNSAGLTNVSGTSASVTVAGTSPLTIGTLTASTGDVSVATGGNLTLTGSAQGRDVALSSAGSVTTTTAAITASDDIVIRAAGTATTGTLTAGPGADTGLSGAGDQLAGTLLAGNQIDVRAGTVAFANGTAAGDITLRSTVGDITLSNNINTPATLSLFSAGAVTQIAGVVTAATLTGSSVGLTALDASINQIGTLEDFGAGEFRLLDGGGLNVAGDVSGTSGVTIGTSGTLAVAATGSISSTGTPISLTASGGGSDITLAGAVNAGSGTVTLTAGNTISQSGSGVVTAGTLTGSSGGSTSLATLTNQIGTLGSFTANGFALNDGGGLTVAGPVNGNAGGVAITTSGDLAVNGTVSATNGPIALAGTGGGSDIVLSNAVNAGTGTVTLNAGATISQNGSGVITAGTLTGSSGGATNLATLTNQITNLGVFTANGFALLDAGGLTVSGLVNGQGGGVGVETSGDLTVNAAVLASNAEIGLTATGASSDIALNAPVNAGTGTVTLTANGSGGTISQTAPGVITAGTLTGSSNGATTLTAAPNAVANLGAFTSNAFAFRNEPALVVTGPVSAGSGALSLEVAGDPLTINGNLTGVGVTVKAAGVTQASASTIDSGSGTVLIDADDGTINMAGAITTTNGGASAVRIIDSGNATLGNITTGAGGTVTLGEASGDALSGNVGQTGGTAILAGTLVGNVGGAATLANSGNNVTTLGAFTANGFALTDANSLTVAGPVSSGTGNLALQVTTGPLALAGDLTAASGTMTLNALNGAITQTGGRIRAATLTGQSVGGTTLNSATNDIAVLAGFTNSGTGGISLVDSRNLTVTAAVNAGPGDLALRAPGINFTGQTLAAGQNALLEAQTGALTGATVTAGNNVTGTGASIDIGTVTATAGALSLIADNGNLTLGTGTAGTTAVLRTTGGAGDVTVTTSLASNTGTTISSVSDARIASASASNGNVSVSAAGEVTGVGAGRANLAAGGAGNDVTVSGGTLARLGTVDAADAVTITADAVDVTSALARAGDLSVAADVGNLTIGTGQGFDVALSSAADLTAGTVAARDDLVIRAVGTATAGTLTSGATVAGNGPADVNGSGDALAGALLPGNVIDVRAGAVSVANAGAAGNLVLQANNGNLTLTAGTAGGTADLSTTGGNGDVIVVASLTSAGNATITSVDDTDLLLVRSTAGSIAVTAADAANAGTLAANGSVNVDGASSTIGTTTAGTSLDVLARSGQLTLGTGSAGTTATLIKQGATGELQVTDALVAGGETTITSSTNARLANVTSSAGNVVVTAAAGEVTGVGAGGRANITAQNDARDVTVTAGALARLGNATAGSDLAVTAGNASLAGSIDVTNATARTGALTLTAFNGDILVGSGIAGTTASLTTNGSGDVLVTNSLVSGGNATFTSADDTDLRVVRSTGGNIVITANDAANAGTLQAAGSIGVDGASIDTGTANAGTSLTMLARSGQLTLGTGTAGTTATLTKQGAAGGLAVGSLTAGGNATLTSSTSSTLGSIASSGGRVEIDTVGATNAGSLSAAGLVDVDSGSAIVGTAAAGTSLTMLARSGQLTLGTGTAGTTATLTKQGGAGELQVTSLTSTGNATLTSSTNQRLGTITSGTGNIVLTATSGSVTGLAAGSDFAGADLNASGSVQLRAGQAGLVRLSDVNATSGSIDIEAGTTAAATSRVEVLDTVSAGGAYRVTGGSVALGDDAGAEAQRAVGLVAVTATNGSITGGAGLTLQSNSDGAGAEALTLTANGTGGAISFAASSQILGGTANGSDVTLDTVGRATAGQVTATGRTIAINANDIELLGANAGDLSARVTASTVNITNRADVANVTRLGNNPAGSAGFDMTQAEVNRIAAGTVTIESGAQDVQIGALALTTAVGSTRLNIQNTGRIDVTGVVEAGGSTNSRTIMLGGNAADAANDPASRRSSVIRVASTASGGGRLLMGGANLDLRGAKIGVGQDNQFLESVGLTPGGTPLPLETVASEYIASPNSTLYAAADKYSDGTILTASTLTVTYSDYALFQNTALPVFEPSGAIVGGLGVNGLLGLTSSGDSAANGFAIFGEINGRTGSQAAVLGPDVIVLKEVNRSNTRINGCVVGSSGGCLVNAVATPNLNVFDSSQVNILRTADDLALSFDPVVGTNNEALFAGLASIDPIAEDAACEDPNSERCPQGQEDQ